MSNAIRTAILCAGIVLLTGCQKANEPVTQTSVLDRSCSSPSATAIIEQIFGDGVEERARNENKQLPDTVRLDLAKVRALASEVRYELKNVITTKNDPNSTKKFCEAELKVVIPDRTVEGANKARKSSEQASIQSIAEDANFKTDLNKFSLKISYNIQPTDDGKNLFVEVENAKPFKLLVSETVLWAAVGAREIELKTSSVQKAIPKENATGATVVPTPANVQPVVEAARDAAVQANVPVDQALIDSSLQFKTLEREINVVWNSLPKDIRDANLETQKAFNKEKEQVCMKEASAAEGKFEIIRNLCWSRFYLQRIPQLKKLI